MEPREIVETFFPQSRLELVVGNVGVGRLLKEHPTPFYVYDAKILRERMEMVRGALGDGVNVLYAMKANPLAAIVKTLGDCGDGLDVASRGEIYIARAIGIEGAKLHFVGPGKSAADMEAALEAKVGTIALESEQELDLLTQLASGRSQKVGVSIRIHPDRALSGSRMRMGGKAEKFGVLSEQAASMIKTIQEDALLEFQGLHMYAGTQCFDAEAWVENCGYLLDLAEELEKSTEVPVRKINFGGGFGVPYFPGEKAFDLAQAGAGLQALIRKHARLDRTYMVELGRFLTAPAGVFVTSVVSKKVIKETSHLVTDGGMNHHAAAAGLGSIVKRPYPMVAATKLREDLSTAYTVGGNLCTPADEFCSQIDLPPMSQGEPLAILMSGAYGLSFSPSAFLSHPSPCELLVDGDQVHVVREAGRVEDFMRGQSVPHAEPRIASVA